jgi:hypothetical protein
VVQSTSPNALETREVKTGSYCSRFLVFDRRRTLSSYVYTGTQVELQANEKKRGRRRLMDMRYRIKREGGYL